MVAMVCVCVCACACVCVAGAALTSANRGVFEGGVEAATQLSGPPPRRAAVSRHSALAWRRRGRAALMNYMSGKPAAACRRRATDGVAGAGWRTAGAEVAGEALNKDLHVLVVPMHKRHADKEVRAMERRH